MKRSKTHMKTSLFQEKPWYQSEKETPLSRILRITADIVSTLPKSIQHPVMKWIDDVGLFLLRIGKIMALPQQPRYLINGKIDGREQFSIFFKGELTSFQFFLKRVYPDQQKLTITPVDKKSFDKKRIKHLRNEVDMVVYETDRFFNHYYQKKGYIVIPETISFILQMDKPIQEIINSCSTRVQNDLLKAKSIGYHYTIGNDLSKFSDFYHTMYLPYVTWKHQDLQKIISFEAMRHYVLRGSKLLLVRIEETDIFGGIFEYEKHHILTQYSGIKQGMFDHIRQGVITISYYFLISIAKQHQMRYIDFGASPPFLKDGLNQYKRNWNMDIIPSKPVYSTIFALQINTLSDSISTFFEKNPFFYFKDKELSLAHHINKDEKNPPTKEEIIKQNHLKGIAPTLYYSFEEFITNR